MLKNGPNARAGWASGGWLDGDAMVHAVAIPPPAERGGAGARGDARAAPARYTRTWLRTAGFTKEEAAGRRLFDGSLVAPHGLRLLAGLARNAWRARQPQKDTANTALWPLRPAARGGERGARAPRGRVLALMEQCLPCEFEVSARGAVRTVAPLATLGGALVDWAAFPFSGGALTAHPKRDPRTGEGVGVSCARARAAGAPLSPLARGRS